MTNARHEWNNPCHLDFFEYDDNGDIVGYRGYEVSGYVECPKHGFYPTLYSGLEIRCKCPKCLEEELMFQKLRGAAIPRRFLNRTIDNFEVSTENQRLAKEAVKSYINDFDRVREEGRSLILCGQPGTGKTHLAIAVAINAINNGGSAIYTTVSELIDRVRETWRRDSQESQSQIVGLYAGVDLLIVDEVGVQAGTENEQHILFDVINKRYGEMRPTIILSNLKPNDIAKYLGQRIWDRLRENGGQAILFTGSSYRTKAKANLVNESGLRKMQIPKWHEESHRDEKVAA